MNTWQPWWEQAGQINDAEQRARFISSNFGYSEEKRREAMRTAAGTAAFVGGLTYLIGRLFDGNR